MAAHFSKSFVFLTIFLTATAQSMVTKSPPQKPRRSEKVTRFRFYWHDVLSGKNPTSVPVAQAASTKTSKTAFGLVRMIDNPLTERPEMTSKLVGRCQGFYASAAQHEVGMLMSMNVELMDSRYNGSTINIMGRNPVLSKVRELPVVGGTGVFRMARGYALLRTRWFDAITGDATVQYDVVVLHH